jgi:hypothetical protein
MPTAALEDDGDGAKEFAGGLTAPLATHFGSLIHAVKDFKSHPAAVASVIVNGHPFGSVTSFDGIVKERLGDAKF